MPTVSYFIFEIYNAVVFMLPSFIGNIAPLFFKRLPIFTCPVDAYRSIGGKRIFGNHKTIRGIIVGVMVGTLVAGIQGRPYIHGTILTFGNFIGDLIGAFIKRRRNIASGQKSLLTDSIPSPLMAILFAYAGGFLTLSLWQAAVIVIGIIPLHLLFNRIWYLSKIKKNPW